MSDAEKKTTPPVPSMDEVVHPEKQHGMCIINREPVDTCDCGGTLYDEEIATGRVILAIWDAEQFDCEEYQLSDEYEQTERRIDCNNCTAGWSY